MCEPVQLDKGGGDDMDCAGYLTKYSSTFSN